MSLRSLRTGYPGIPPSVRRCSAVAVLLSAFSLLWGCAALPETVDGPVSEDAPGITEARVSPDRHQGKTVRWGGSIAGVENRSDHTLVEVVARPLQSSGRPRSDTDSDGRFLVVIDEFLDPAVYEKGRLITVLGNLDGVENRKVGDYDYPYPVVRARGHELWQPLPDRRYAGPYYYDPWYYRDPFLRSPYWYHDPFFPRHRYW